LYVDDFASGKDSVKDNFELYRKLKSCFREGGLNMRKWESINQELTDLVKEERVAESSTPELSPVVTLAATKSNVIEDGDCLSCTSNNTVSEETLIKVVGVPWDRIKENRKLDLITFPGKALEGTLSKRETVEHYCSIQACYHQLSCL